MVLLLSLLTIAANSEHICTSVMTLSARYVLTHSHSKIGTVIREVGTPFERPREVEQFAEGHTASWWWHWDSNPEAAVLKNMFCKSSSLPETLG